MAEYYFAWIDPGETAFLEAHKRFDEEVFDFNIHHAEGDFPTLDITIINPNVGLLNPGRKVWAWFGYEHPTAGTVPLFRGRLIGIPEDLQNEQVRLSFIARPLDFAEQKAAVAETKKTRPYWDPIWFSGETKDDPDNVLESRPELWHIDRLTLAVTTSNIIDGEDGNISLGEDDVFFDSVRMHYTAPPLRRIEMIASVGWDQKAAGFLDITKRLLTAFQGANSGTGSHIYSYTGEGLVSDWPKNGASLGGGWAVANARAVPRSYFVPFTIFEPGYSFAPSSRPDGVPFEYFTYDGFFQPHGGLLFPKWKMSIKMELGYDVSRQRSETLSFALEADVQSILVDPGDEDVLQLSMSSSELTQPVDESGNLPIRDQRAASYFATERGAESIEYLLALCRARLLARARCVQIDVEIPFDDAVLLGLSCRKNIILTDYQMPGGLAAGKIIDYQLSLNGDDGTPNCSITFASTVGQGNEVEAVEGDPDYCDDDYVDPDYQVRIDEFVMPITGEIIYRSIDGTLPNDDGINFFAMSDSLVTSVVIDNGANEQQGLFPFHGTITPTFPLGDWSQYYLVDVSGSPPGSFRPDYNPSNAIGAINDRKTTVDLKLKPLTGGPFLTIHDLEVSMLMIPKQIDLEASST